MLSIHFTSQKVKKKLTFSSEKKKYGEGKMRMFVENWQSLSSLEWTNRFLLSLCRFLKKISAHDLKRICIIPDPVGENFESSCHSCDTD